MTIAISLKVNDGLVLASDSAATIIQPLPQAGKPGVGVVNIYENANKIFNLYKGLPVGAITWGSGSIGQSSISTLAKDFRDSAKSDPQYKIDPENFTIEEIANKFKTFMFDNHYIDAFKTWPNKPALGFMVVGYSSGQPLAEEWRIDIINNTCNGPIRVRQQNEIGMTWNGEGEAITRLYMGFGTGLGTVLQMAGLAPEKINEVIDICRKHLVIPMVIPPMPIQDAIDLAAYFVETTIRFAKYSPGAPTVGGPIEVASITKHEGFKWVMRKHFFDPAFNPK